MSDAAKLLERVDEGIAAHGGDLGGWTKLGDDALVLFDGRITLRCEVEDSERPQFVHAHLKATLHEHDEELLDACIFGMGDDREAALGQAAALWITCVAGPIKSFLDNKPVCMTCQASVADGDIAAGYSRGDYGLPGLRAFVGPCVVRGTEDDFQSASLGDTAPWFRYAAEAAAPRRVHLAKVTIQACGPQGWRRDLEIDGHDISHREHNWPAGVAAPKQGYLVRFAVFEFPRNSREIARRTELERTIRHFAQNFSKHQSVDDLCREMERQGFDGDLVAEVESISTLAFGRVFFERFHVNYPATIIRARRDGRVEMDVPLMSLPAYSRARALAPQISSNLTEEQFQAICFYGAESQGLLQAIESQTGTPDFSGFTLYPPVVPDQDVSHQTMQAALARLQGLIDQNKRAPAKKKPWWKFW